MLIHCGGDVKCSNWTCSMAAPSEGWPVRRTQCYPVTQWQGSHWKPPMDLLTTVVLPCPRASLTSGPLIAGEPSGPTLGSQTLFLLVWSRDSVGLRQRCRISSYVVQVIGRFVFVTRASEAVLSSRLSVNTVRSA